MERISNESNKPLYRKLPGTGGLRLRSSSIRRIKPGEKVRITAEELGKSINEFELIEESVSSQERHDESEGVNKERFTVTPRGSGWFDVIDTLVGEKVNVKKYRQNEAEKYAKDLNTGG